MIDPCSNANQDFLIDASTMKSHSLTFGGVVVEAPLSWHDITEEIDAAEPPFTLADTSKDVGALQFSIARHESGPPPQTSPEELLGMAKDLGAYHGLTDRHDEVMESGPPMLGAVSYLDADFIRVWYVSDGRNFAKITFTCPSGMQFEQLAECETIVRSLRFL